MKRIDDIDNVINQLTLEEKAKLVNGYNFFGSHAIERLGIERIQFLDGGTGINFEQLFGDFTQMKDWSMVFDDCNKDKSLLTSKLLKNVISNYYNREKLSEEEFRLCEWIDEILADRLKGKVYSPACFPAGILLGATWNKNIVCEVGRALGIEALIYGIDVLLGTPNINIHRDPLNGRLFEGYSEDPYLVSALTPFLVKGVQEKGVAANVKHFAANNQETNRIGLDEIISERALEEIYLSGFKACVTEGKVKTVMTAYNKINGVPCTENRWLIDDKLRKEYGFEGIVVSDWGAVYNDVAALSAGNDLAMPGPRNWRTIYEAVKSGKLKETVLDCSIKRLLGLINWIADEKEKAYVNSIDFAEAKKYTDEVAYKSAAEGIVLLENSCLPLSNKVKLVLKGSGAEKLLECGQGSAGIHTDRVGNLYNELCAYVGCDNVSIEENDAQEENDAHEESGTHEENTYNIFIASVGGMEGNDRIDLRLSKADREKLNNCNKKTILVLNTCGPVELDNINRENVVAVLAVFLPGMGGAKALADIIFGRVNPSGKLPLTFPRKYCDTPTYLNFPGDGKRVYYGEGIYVGYRYYDKKEIEPMYPFGYGLSYTTFEKTLISVVHDESTIYATVKIKNTGVFAGSEVIQVYVSDIWSTLGKPVKELKGFEKVFLNVGEERKITIQIAKNSLASYDTDNKQFVLEEGYYDIIVSTSSHKTDEFGRKRIYIDTLSIYSYGTNSSIKTIIENDELNLRLYKIMKKYQIDEGYVKDAYQYYSNKTFGELVDEISELSDEAKQQVKEEFNQLAKAVKKK